MKTRIQILLFLIIMLVGSASVFYATKVPHYSLEIQGMKDTYVIGEKYSFYYTLSGFGNTCGNWIVQFPDQNGKMVPRGEVVDCFKPTNKELKINSETFNSQVPIVPGIYNVTVSIEKIGEPVIFEFTVLSSESEPEQDESPCHGCGGPVSFDNYKIDCNGIDGKKELKCFSEAFESCNEATMNYIIYTIEGDPRYFEGSVEGGDSCYVGVVFDNTEDRFSHPDDRIVTETRCTNIEFTKHTMNIGECDDSFDYQLNYQSPDWPSHENCNSIDGEWSYEFHNCVVIDDSISLCKDNGGTIACMSDEQKETMRDICLPVCEFKVVDRK